MLKIRAIQKLEGFTQLFIKALWWMCLLCGIEHSLLIWGLSIELKQYYIESGYKEAGNTMEEN